jgi:CheY-like chemotaxis protein
MKAVVAPPLPRASRRMKAVAAPPAAPEVDAQSPTPVSLAESKGAASILVVEDDEATRRLIVRALRTVYTVYEAPDGEQAAQLLDAHPAVHCVVSDVMMPKLSGTDLARRMRLDSRLKNIPIVFVTAKRSAGDVAEGLGAGARFYLSKPFRLKGLLSKVAEAMARP